MIIEVQISKNTINELGKNEWCTIKENKNYNNK